MSGSSAKKDRAPVDLAAQSALRWRALYLMAAFGVFCVDQLSKAWAIRRLRLGEEISVVPGFARFIYAENTGVAFSQLQNGGAGMRWLLASFAVLAAVGVTIYFFRTPRSDDRVLGACALLLAGILGNLTDRVRFGYVIDFILLYAGNFHYPVFNVADMSICAGALLLAYDAFFGKNSRTPATPPEAA